MKGLTLAIIWLFLSLVCGAQSNPQGYQIDIPKGPQPWTSLDFNNDEDQFQFAIVTDRTGGHRPGVFLQGVHKLNLLQPEFVLSVGDLIEGYTRDTLELRRQWEEFDGFVEQLQMPFFYLPGNHDITNEVMEQVWQQRLGPTHYYFIYQDVLFLCLNSEDQYRGSSRGSISDAQYAWIKQVLEDNTEVRWTMVFMHQPLWVQEADPIRWFDVEALLANRPHSVFAGHRHHYVKYERNQNNYYMLATTGGGSPLRGPELGEFDHVVWVTMTKAGPVIANLQLEGIWDEDLVTAEVEREIATINGTRPFRIEPIYYEGESFEGGNARIKITNDANLPLLVELDDQFSWGYTSSLSANKVEVAPNAVSFVDLTITPRKKNSDPGQAVGLAATIAYQQEGRNNKIAIPLQYKIAPEQKYYIEHSPKAVTVDGQLDEWKDLPFAIDTKAAEATDISGQFGISYDEDYVYVAARITDDQVAVSSEETTWRQDFAGLILDAAPQTLSAMRTGSGWYSNSIIYIMSPETDQAESTSFYEERLPEGTQWSCRATTGGYVMEGAIPLAYVRERQGDDWQTLRVNFVVQDRDSDDQQFSPLSWMPDWRGADNRVGSGMFFRK